MASYSTISTEATSEQTVLKPKPLSRKVLAFAGVASFVLGNRSCVEILIFRTRAAQYVYFGRADHPLCDTGVLAVTATPGTPSPGLRGSTATELLLDGDCTRQGGRHPLQNPKTCDCDYSSAGGCKISNVVDFPGCACKCIYDYFWTCHGEDANCKDKESDACKNPDASKAACEQGGGDCGGYTD